MRSSPTSPPEVARECRNCGRAFVTYEVALYGRRFPADRYCVPCREADRADEDQKRAEILLAQAHLPARYRECDFGSFREVLGNREALAAATAWSRRFRHGPRPQRGLLFQGPPGAGKTHLSVAILREVVFATSTSALFLNVPEWLNDMKAAFQTGEGTLPPSPRGFGLLVLDDLGAERTTAWSADQLYGLVNHRETNALPTIASTNLSAGELESRLGRATMSRLSRLCATVRVDPGADFRVAPV